MVRGPGINVPYALRRIEVWDAEKQQTFVFLTNHDEFAATTIAAIYKERWQIELFFKALKQNLKIKTFGGDFPNAVKIQVWTALIAMLVLRYLKLKSKFSWSLSNLVALLRMNLFTYRDLWALVEPTLWNTCPSSGKHTVRRGFRLSNSDSTTGVWFQKDKKSSKYLGKSMAIHSKPG